MMFLALFGCDSGGADETGGTVDLRLAESDYRELGDGDILWEGPEVTVPPGTDAMYCLFGTYTGEDVGLHTLETWQNEFGHHLQLMGTVASELDFPDGEVVDCTAANAVPMASLEPIIIATWQNHADLELPMPDGMAIKLDEGQRWVLQAHYVNTGSEEIVVKDVAVSSTIPEGEVETWAAPLIVNTLSFSIPPGESLQASIGCAFEEDYSLLYTLGHMHEYGTSIRVDEVAEERESILYTQPTWDPGYRDSPPVTYFDGGHALPTGTEVRVTCDWYNYTDETIAFPSEMCVSVSLAYPSLNRQICTD